MKPIIVAILLTACGGYSVRHEPADRYCYGDESGICWNPDTGEACLDPAGRIIVAAEGEACG
jgi:hypothetical protein